MAKPEVLGYIDLLQSAAPHEMISIFTHGGCWWFHLLLKDKYPDAVPYKVIEDGTIRHVVTLIDGDYYDIRGVFEDESTPMVMSDADCRIAEMFKYPVMQIKDEPQLHRHLNHMRIVRKLIRILAIGLFPVGIYYTVLFNNPRYALMSLELTVCLWITRYIVENMCMDTFNYCPNCGQRIRWPIRISDTFK